MLLSPKKSCYLSIPLGLVKPHGLTFLEGADRYQTSAKPCLRDPRSLEWEETGREL